MAVTDPSFSSVVFLRPCARNILSMFLFCCVSPSLRSQHPFYVPLLLCFSVLALATSFLCSSSVVFLSPCARNILSMLLFCCVSQSLRSQHPFYVTLLLCFSVLALATSFLCSSSVVFLRPCARNILSMLLFCCVSQSLRSQHPFYVPLLLCFSVLALSTSFLCSSSVVFLRPCALNILSMFLFCCVSPSLRSQHPFYVPLLLCFSVLALATSFLCSSSVVFLRPCALNILSMFLFCCVSPSLRSQHPFYVPLLLCFLRPCALNILSMFLFCCVSPSLRSQHPFYVPLLLCFSVLALSTSFLCSSSVVFLRPCALNILSMFLFCCVSPSLRSQHPFYVPLLLCFSVLALSTSFLCSSSVVFLRPCALNILSMFLFCCVSPSLRSQHPFYVPLLLCFSVFALSTSFLCYSSVVFSVFALSTSFLCSSSVVFLRPCALNILSMFLFCCVSPSLRSQHPFYVPLLLCFSVLALSTSFLCSSSVVFLRPCALNILSKFLFCCVSPSLRSQHPFYVPLLLCFSVLALSTSFLCSSSVVFLRLCALNILSMLLFCCVSPSLRSQHPFYVPLLLCFSVLALSTSFLCSSSVVFLRPCARNILSMFLKFRFEQPTYLPNILSTIVLARYFVRIRAVFRALMCSVGAPTRRRLRPVDIA